MNLATFCLWTLGISLTCFAVIYAWIEITELCDEADEMAHFQNPHDPEP